MEQDGKKWGSLCKKVKKISLFDSLNEKNSFDFD